MVRPWATVESVQQSEDRGADERPMSETRMSATFDLKWLRKGHNIERARRDLAKAVELFWAELESAEGPPT